MWKLPFQLLRLFCPDYLLEEIEGDLEQKFRDRQRQSRFRANLNLLFSVVLFFRPGIVFRNKLKIQIPFAMIQNYILIATRIIWRNKTYSGINILGLALGLTSTMLLFLWIDREFSYDQFHEKKDQLYTVWSRNTLDGTIQCWDNTPRVLAPTLLEEYAGFEKAVSYADYNTAYLFTAGDTRIMKNSGAFTDPDFLTLFNFPLVKGSLKDHFKNPASIVLTESFARELFGDREAFGETVVIGESGESYPLTVTGIVKDLPSNTQFHFDYLLPFSLMESVEGKDTDWGNHSVRTFVRVKKGAPVEKINEELKTIVKRHSNHNNDTKFFLYPVTKTRLYARFENGVPAGGRIEIMRMIGLLGIFLLLIACINFINLSTARAQKRCKEIGVRKVTGAQRITLIFQFMCESFIITLLAAVVSILSGYLVLPFFSSLIDQPITFNFYNLHYWLWALFVVIGVALLAGLYPAFYLSSFNPVRVLKGAVVSLSNRNLLRKSLVVFQFGFAITLIISVIVVWRQINHVMSRDRGYDQDNLVYHFITGNLNRDYNAYKAELLQSGAVSSLTRTSSPITQGWSNTWAIEWNGKDPNNKTVVDRFYIDENIARTAGVHIVKGRDMDLQRYPSDSTAVLLNEAAVKLMGFDNPVGELIKDSNVEWHVVGVVEDFVLSSPMQAVRPMVLQGSKGWFSVIHIRLNEHLPVQQSMETIERIFKKHNPDYPFEYTFVDQAYDQKFASLQSTLTISTVFGVLAIIISSLGLLGLSTYMIESRVKEVGIRKVLGGSVAGITKLLCIESLKPILLAIILFSPLAWWSMDWWLKSYAYRVQVGLGTMLLAGLSMIVIAVLVMGYQTLQAAMANPVNSLKSE